MELPGFDREQQRLLTALVRWHIGTLKPAEFFKFARYSEQDVMALMRLLRLAVILNKSRQATETAKNFTLEMHRTLNDWTLNFESGYLDRNPLIWNELRAESNLLKEFESSLVFY